MLICRLFDLRLLAPAVLAAASIALAGAAGAPAPTATAAATGLSVPGCIEVEPGETFEVSILVADVTDILAWDVYYAYNRKVVEVTKRDVGAGTIPGGDTPDVRQILEQLPNSNVFDLSDPVPNTSGTYRLGAADTGGTGAAESGSGILATLTLHAKAKGISWSSIYRADVNGDGTVDIGPTLTAIGGQHIGDTDGDGIFDGVIASGQIAVDRKCANPAPTAPPPSGVVVVNPPTASATPAEVGEPTVSLIETQTPIPTPAATLIAETPATDQPSRTRTPTPEVGSDRPGTGGTGSPLSSWLIGLLVGSAAVGVVLSYVVYRTSRRLA